MINGYSTKLWQRPFLLAIRYLLPANETARLPELSLGSPEKPREIPSR